MAMSAANGQNNRLHLSFGVTDNPSNSNAETPAVHYHTILVCAIYFMIFPCMCWNDFEFPHPEVVALPVISIEVQFFCHAPVEFADVKLSLILRLKFKPLICLNREP
jgi:hypothetical protein